MVRCYGASSFVWLSFVGGGGAVPAFTEVDDGKHEPPRVGLVALEGCTVSTTDEACTQNADMVEALDADPYISGEDIIRSAPCFFCMTSLREVGSALHALHTPSHTHRDHLKRAQATNISN